MPLLAKAATHLGLSLAKRRPSVGSHVLGDVSHRVHLPRKHSESRRCAAVRGWTNWVRNKRTTTTCARHARGRQQSTQLNPNSVPTIGRITNWVPTRGKITNWVHTRGKFRQLGVHTTSASKSANLNPMLSAALLPNVVLPAPRMPMMMRLADTAIPTLASLWVSHGQVTLGLSVNLEDDITRPLQ